MFDQTPAFSSFVSQEGAKSDRGGRLVHEYSDEDYYAKSFGSTSFTD